MLQNELKLQLKKVQSQNKALFIIIGVLLLSTIVIGVLLFTNNQIENTSTDSKQVEINQSPTLQVKNIEIDTTQKRVENLSTTEMITKLDSMAYIIDTLQFSLVKARAKSQRDYERYITASNYKPAAKVIKQDNVTSLIETAKKYTETDCKKALSILYATKKIAEIEGTLDKNNNTINTMMRNCLKE